VTIQDLDGTSHTAVVTASTLFEAVAQGLAALRKNEWVEGIQERFGIVKVSVDEVRVEHQVRVAENRGPTGLIARGEPPPASSKRIAPPHKAVGPISSAPRDLAPYKPAPNTGAVPHLPRPSTILVTVPGRSSQPFTVSFPEKAIAATSSVAMTSQLSVLVSPAPGPALGHRSARLETGELVSFVWPRYRRPKDRYGLAETIRVRATVGPFGQVLEVKFVSGSISLLPATMRAVRQWRYRPISVGQEAGSNATGRHD
jgi:hypothetical protein